MSASASWGGVRLLAGCAAINLTLAAIGWLWQGGYVAPALLDKVSRSGTLTLGSWNWNAIHVVLWALWLSGWFAFLAARLQLSRLNGPAMSGPALHKPAMTLAAAGSAASIFWLMALADVAKRLWALDAGRLPAGGPWDGLLRWTALPLFIGAGVAIFCFVMLLRWRPDSGVAESPESEAEESSSPERAGDVSPPSSRSTTRAASRARSEQIEGSSPTDTVEDKGSPRTDSGDSRPPLADDESTDVDGLPRTKRDTKTQAAEQSTVRTLQFGAAALSLAGFGLFWQFVAYGPAETTWSLDRLFSGPAAEGWAALTFLTLAHVAHIVSGALTVFDGPKDETLAQASGGRKSPVSETDASDNETQ